VRVLAGDVQRVRVVGAAVRGHGRARLDRVRNQPVVDDVDLGDVRGLGERRVDGGLVAQRPRVALVAGCLFVDLRRAGFERGNTVHHRRQHLVVDIDQLRGVLRLVRRLGDDQRDRVADVAHLALRQHRMRRLVHRLAVGARDEPAARQAVHPLEVGPGEHGDHPRRGLCLRGVDLADLCVGVRRAQEVRVRVVRRVDVVGVLPRAGQEAQVFPATDGLADQAGVVGTHRRPPTSPSRRRRAPPP